MAATLTVMTFDLAATAGDERPFVARFGDIVALIREVNPDVLCLQHVPATELVRRVAGYLLHQQKRAMFSACTKVGQPEDDGDYLAIIHPGTRRVAETASAGGSRAALTLKLAASGVVVVNAVPGIEGEAASAAATLIPREGVVVVAGATLEADGLVAISREKQGDGSSGLMARAVTVEPGAAVAAPKAGASVRGGAAWARISTP